ncbi:MAG: hypothetical protein WCZ43_09630 [Proteiniphilum sp.]
MSKTVEISQHQIENKIFTIRGKQVMLDRDLAELIRKAKKSIILIDNYIDESVLQLFIKWRENVSVTIYTKSITKILAQDLEKHNAQYPKIEIEIFTKAHDRFLMIDKKELYHIGASLKNLGKKWFAFSRVDSFMRGSIE